MGLDPNPAEAERWLVATVEHGSVGVHPQLGVYWEWTEEDEQSPVRQADAGTHLATLGIPVGGGAGVRYYEDRGVAVNVHRVFVLWEHVGRLLEHAPGLQALLPEGRPSA
jgi:hypothetical protein